MNSYSRVNEIRGVDILNNTSLFMTQILYCRIIEITYQNRYQDSNLIRRSATEK